MKLSDRMISEAEDALSFPGPDNYYGNLIKMWAKEVEKLEDELRMLHADITIFECNYDLGHQDPDFDFWGCFDHVKKHVPPYRRSLTWAVNQKRAKE